MDFYQDDRLQSTTSLKSVLNECRLCYFLSAGTVVIFFVYFLVMSAFTFYEVYFLITLLGAIKTGKVQSITIGRPN